jgi:hypothetical protein
MNLMGEARVDRRGIISFLLITFALTYCVEIALILTGFRFSQLPATYGTLVVAGAMWIPAFSTLICIRFITREGWGLARIQIGSYKPYLATAVILPIAFALI